MCHKRLTGELVVAEAEAREVAEAAQRPGEGPRQVVALQLQLLQR